MRYLQLWPGIGPKTAEKIVSAIVSPGTINAIELLEGRLGARHPGLIGYKSQLNPSLGPKMLVKSATHTLFPILETRYDRWHLRRKDLELLATVAERCQTLVEFIDAFTLEPMTNT
jgi:DNA helicase-2/ATP-dependent DNA helicase PcrA